MNLETLIENATNDELRGIVTALQRANAKPAVLVTVQEGSKRRRYVVAQEDEEQLRPLVGLSRDHWSGDHHHWFGAQWLRGYGKVDEMYRSIGLYDVVKVEEADRARVWGR